MEMVIHFPGLPGEMTFEEAKLQLAEILDDDGWLTASNLTPEGAGWIEMELEDEKSNPKHGIMAVRSYLRREEFPRGTTLELAGMASDIYDARDLR